MRDSEACSPSAAAVFALSVPVALGSPQFAADSAESSWTIDAIGQVEISPDEMSDLQMSAEELGISLEEAVERYGWQNAFALGVTKLQEKYPGSFSSATMGGAAGPAVSFKGKAPKDLKSILGGLPVDVRVTENVAWSEQELVEAGQAIHYAAQDNFNEAYEVQTDIDVVSGTVTVSTNAPLSRSNLLDEPSVGAATELLPEGTDLVLEEVPALTGGDDTVYGGGMLRTCTAGFSVRNSTYSHGLLTAGHCDNSQTYAGRSVLTFRAAMAKSKGDAQWHSSSEAASARFYVAPGELRYITATANAVVDQRLCKYGKTTKNTCDNVYKTNQCKGDYCNLIMMHRRKAEVSDSGGPWFWGGTGYGIHQGWKFYAPFNRDLYTPLRSTASNLSVTVKLGS